MRVPSGSEGMTGGHLASGVQQRIAEHRSSANNPKPGLRQA